MQKETKQMEQTTIHPDLLEGYQKAGWRYVGAITDEKLVVERPLDDSKSTEGYDENDPRRYFK